MSCSFALCLANLLIFCWSSNVTWASDSLKQITSLSSKDECYHMRHIQTIILVGENGIGHPLTSSSITILKKTPTKTSSVILAGVLVNWLKGKLAYQFRNSLTIVVYPTTNDTWVGNNRKAMKKLANSFCEHLVNQLTITLHIAVC